MGAKNNAGRIYSSVNLVTLGSRIKTGDTGMRDTIVSPLFPLENLLLAKEYMLKNHKNLWPE